MLESLFNKVVKLKPWNFIKKRLQHRCFPVNIATYLKTPILKNTCKWLLLKISYFDQPWSEHGSMIRCRRSQVLYKKICFEKRCLSICNFTKKRLLHRCFLGILQNFIEKDLCWSLFLICKIRRKALVGESLFNTVSGLDPTTLLKKKLRHEFSPVSFEIFFWI